eukprot:10213717-Alexandrium_andersonii.AAC.1
MCIRDRRSDDGAVAGHLSRARPRALRDPVLLWLALRRGELPKDCLGPGGHNCEMLVKIHLPGNGGRQSSAFRTSS